MTIPDDTKYCRKCDTFKPLSAFGKNKGTPDGLRYRCKSCSNADTIAFFKKKGKEWVKNFNKRYVVKKRITRRNSELKSKYGIDAEIYLAMFAAQGNCCAICKGTKSRSRWKTDFAFHVDHCHRTGKVRGILCMKCNSGIGIPGDNLEIALRIVEYLRRAEDENFIDGGGI